MSKFRRSYLCLFIILTMMIFSPTQSISDETKVLFLKVKKSKLRTSPDFLSNTHTTINYGDTLSIIEDASPWYKVKTISGKTGFIHTSAISTRAVVLDPHLSFNSSHKKNKNIVMAGKGFNKKVENSYKKGNKKLNYAAVDRMEKRDIAPHQLRSFAKAGKLN